MKYQKPQVEIVEFETETFMTASGIPSPCSGYNWPNHTCGTYVPGNSCASWTTTSFGGGTCNNYNGKKCFGYTDSTHNLCSEYGVSCATF